MQSAIHSSGDRAMCLPSPLRTIDLGACARDVQLKLPTGAISHTCCSRRSSLSMVPWVPFWTVTSRCISAIHTRLIARCAVRVQKSVKPTLWREGKPCRLLAGWRLASALCAPCWFRWMVAQYSGGPPARLIMRTHHIVSQGSNWARSRAARRCKYRRDSQPSGPKSSAADRGPGRRRPCNSQLATVCSVPWSRGWHSRSGREHPARPARGHRFYGPPNWACEVRKEWQTDAAPGGRRSKGRLLQPDYFRSAKDATMRKIDTFAHILPRAYLERLVRQLEQTMAPSQLDYYREGVFSFDPVLTDLDARWRKIESYGDYAQVLVLAVPPLEEVGPPEVAAEFARIANDEMAALVQQFPDRFVGFAAALPLSDVEAAMRELDRALKQLGALGAQMYTNVLGVALDDPRFEPLFTSLEEADRAVWLHPTRSAAWADYPAESRSDFGLWWSIGWPYETAAALSRLVYSGHMERHPRQRVIAHHGGGMRSEE